MHRDTTGNFRQIKVVATHELPSRLRPGGRLGVAVYAKPLNVEWTQRHLWFRTSVEATSAPLESVEDVMSAVCGLIEEVFFLDGGQTP